MNKVGAFILPDSGLPSSYANQYNVILAYWQIHRSLGQNRESEINTHKWSSTDFDKVAQAIQWEKIIFLNK